MELLNTAAAAVLLGVSEASVRRWADRGMLPVTRIGRRQDRRFREPDLRAFLERGQQRGTGPSASTPTPSVVLGGISVPSGSHVAAFYDSDAGRLRLSLPFLRDGVRRGDHCLLIASGPILDQYMRGLRQELGVELDDAIKAGRFETKPAPGTNPSAAIDDWEAWSWAALGDGATFLRAVGEVVTGFASMASPSDMLDFERGLTVLVKRFPCVVICPYDIRRFDGETVLEAIKAHPDMFSLGIQNFLP
jgi:excisionase family DNA binding protein